MDKPRLELPSAPPVTGRPLRPPQQFRETDSQPREAPVVDEPASLPPSEDTDVAEDPAVLRDFDDASIQQIGNLLQEFIVGLDGKKRFGDALLVSRLHRNLQPQNLTAFYTEALMLISLGRYVEAKNVILNAPEAVWNYPQFHHNMACIEVALGNHGAALEHATSAAHQNKNALREMLKDPDLKPIWKSLKQNTKGIL